MLRFPSRSSVRMSTTSTFAREVGAPERSIRPGMDSLPMEPCSARHAVTTSGVALPRTTTAPVRAASCSAKSRAW